MLDFARYFSVAKREYPRFLKRFTSYVIEQTRNKPILFWWSLFLTHWHSICILFFFFCYIDVVISIDIYFFLSRVRAIACLSVYIRCDDLWILFQFFCIWKINIEEVIIQRKIFLAFRRYDHRVYLENCKYSWDIQV